MLTVAYIHRFLTSLGFSIVVETLVLMFILKTVLKYDIPKQKIIVAGIFSTFATIPYVWFVFPHLIDWPPSTAILYSEVFVTLVEAIFYRLYLKTTWMAAIISSIACNLSSYLLGPFLRAHGFWVYW